MLRFLGIVFSFLAVFAACAKTSDPFLPSPLSVAQEKGELLEEKSQKFVIWASLDVELDLQTGSFSILHRAPEVSLRHYRVSYFLLPPQCSNCINIVGYQSEPKLGTGTVIISITNPTNYVAYEVRGVVRTKPTQSLKLLNPDGYTELFASPEYLSPSPFKLFARNSPEHAFHPGETNIETFKLKTQPGSSVLQCNFLVTAGYPQHPGDVSRISDFVQRGDLLAGGGSAEVSLKVEDVQSDVLAVSIDLAPLGLGKAWLSPSGELWLGQIQNVTAPPGLYDLKVDAYSPNPQDAFVSHYFKAVVFHPLQSFRSALVNLVNADRSANGIGPLQLDSALNTVAQAHAQDMADKKYFDHINLDGLSPWERMDYYGIFFTKAGENIAVGQDTPAEVEAAWMASAGHKANILNPSFGKIGIGIAPIKENDPYSPGYYWVQVFTN